MACSQLINLSSADGAKLLNDVQTGCHGCCCQSKLINVFTKQSSRYSCGLVSCALVLSAYHHNQMALSKPAFTEENIMSMPATLSAISQQKMTDDGGLTLTEVGDVLKAHGCGVTVVHASDSSVEKFRQHSTEALSHADSRSAVIVNYHMSTLGQTPFFGHHSPLAAYHADTDRFLLLDVWPDTSECWATAGSLFAAMNTVDDASGKTRGYCIAEF